MSLPGVFILVAAQNGSRDIAILLSREAPPGYRWCLRYHRGVRRIVRRPTLAPYLGVARPEDLERQPVSDGERAEIARLFDIRPRLYAAERRAS
jgi:hypothetical protein